MDYLLICLEPCRNQIDRLGKFTPDLPATRDNLLHLFAHLADFRGQFLSLLGEGADMSEVALLMG